MVVVALVQVVVAEEQIEQELQGWKRDPEVLLGRPFFSILRCLQVFDFVVSDMIYSDMIYNNCQEEGREMVEQKEYSVRANLDEKSGPRNRAEVPRKKER